MALTPVPKHWFVASYVAAEVPGTATLTDPDGIGTLAGSVGRLYADLPTAKTAAKTLAAAAPGAVFVVYEATWYAEVDVTPVTLAPVAFAVAAE